MPDIKAPFEDEKFNKIYRFVILTTMCVFIYLFCASFLPINDANKDNIKTILIFLLGYMSGNSSYLTSGNPSATKKPETPPIVGDGNVVNNDTK